MTTRPLRRRLAPAVALLLLAPWTAECVWGGFTLLGMPFVVVLLAPMYGGAALLIRETARRLGLGWPGIVLLAAAFGVVQAGLVDQSLFNPDFLDDTQFADTRAAAEATLVPGLGFSARQAVDYVGNHVALTICAAIALVESYLGAGRRSRPWLGRPGLAVTALLWLGGSLLVFADDGGRKGFLASPVQLLFAAGVAMVLITVALRRARRPVGRPGDRDAAGQDTVDPDAVDPNSAGQHAVGQDAYPARSAGTWAAPTVARRAPRPIWPALVVLVAYLGAGIVPGWPGVGLALMLAAVTAVLLTRWSRRAGWGQRHVLAAGSASVLAAAVSAYDVPTYSPSSPAADLVGDVAISVIVVLLVGGAWWRLRRAARDRRRAAAPAGHPASPPA
ncbi:hypothetical protein O7598_27460 [Micromonospora sp. WMMC241]|uniref:hypothetical protein n=1 Tax=Micromonospora sp. WMMC241 TaxID=3015159 RepID=UPI0022B6CB31|nr:hypothetical protein [Micromonospora sp. WMMC241]MCZ7440170.1 hypothetical protein [Micromonospora sp. WMMC241]